MQHCTKRLADSYIIDRNDPLRALRATNLNNAIGMVRNWSAALAKVGSSEKRFAMEDEVNAV